MNQQLQNRLEQLRQEYKKGQQKLQQLDQERKVLYETMLRIAGAIQVLEEETGKENGQAAAPAMEVETETQAN